jgi:N-methylhydantoinase A
MRYLGQNYELELPIREDDLATDKIGRLWEMFHEAHAARFGFSTPGETLEVVNYLVTVTAANDPPELPTLSRGEGRAVAAAERAVIFPSGRQDVPVFRRDRLRAGDRCAGPAVIEEPASVTIVNAGQELTVDDFGNLIISRL